jgi:hypothetical protein
VNVRNEVSDIRMMAKSIKFVTNFLTKNHLFQISKRGAETEIQTQIMHVFITFYFILLIGNGKQLNYFKTEFCGSALLTFFRLLQTQS